MNHSINYLSDWWRWWSNPLINMHNSHIQQLPYAQKQLEEIDYLFFLELRSILSMPDKPDRNLRSNQWLLSLALASEEDLQHLKKLYAVLTFEPAILQLNAHAWSDRYAIRSSEEVRDIIQLWNQIPHKIKSWQESLISNLNVLPNSKFSLDERFMIALGAHLLNFHPNYFKRWSLTIPYNIALVIKSVEALPEASLESLNEWLGKTQTDIHQTVLNRYPNRDVDYPFEASESETAAISALENLEDFSDA